MGKTQSVVIVTVRRVEVIVVCITALLSVEVVFFGVVVVVFFGAEVVVLVFLRVMCLPGACADIDRGSSRNRIDR